MVVAVALALALCACAAGCDGDDAAAPADGGSGDAAAPGSVELGKGEQVFEPLAADETLPISAGTQGGHHVYVGFRMRGLGADRVLVKVTTSVEGHPELDLDRSGRVNFAPEAPPDDDEDGGATAGAGGAADGAFIYAGWPAQILAAPMHEGERARIAVTLEDRLGRTASTAQTIVIGPLD